MNSLQRALLVLLAVALPSEVASAQITQAPLPPHPGLPPTLRPWAQTYGTDSPYEGMFDMRLDPGGNLRIAGYGSPLGTVDAAGLLMNLASGDGELRTQDLVLNMNGGTVDGAALAADGGALFSGRVIEDFFTKHDAWVVRVDAQGLPLWQRGFTVTGFGRFFILDAVELSSGAWIIAGVTSVLDQPPQAAYIVRLSASGTVDWQYEYIGGISENVQSITATSDGGFAIAGSTNSSGAGMEDAWIMKLDGAGAIQWQRTFGGHDCDQANWIIEMSGGGYAIAARTCSFTQSGNAPWILRLDAQGNLLWHRIADGVWGDVNSVAETNSGGVVALGRVGQAGFQTNDLWAIEFGPNGTPLWQRAYEGDSGDWGSVVLALPDSCFIFGGTWGWGFPEDDLFVIRTAKNGRLPGCGLDRQTSFSLISPTLLGLAGVATRVPGVALNRVYAFAPARTGIESTKRCY